MNEPQYAKRDPMALDKAGNYYCRHAQAMTAEGLHAKSDIAAELAYRDMQIDQLRAAREVKDGPDWKQVAIAQDAKLRAMCDEPGGLEKLRTVLAQARSEPTEAQIEAAAMEMYGLPLRDEHRERVTRVLRAALAAKDK